MKLFIFILSLFSCTTPEIGNYATLLDYENTQKDLEVLQHINEYRETIGINTLQLDSYLSVECYNHNKTMISLGTITHSGFEYRASRIKQNLSTDKVAECLSYGFNEPLVGWLNSPPHKKIIESADYNYIGISFTEGYCTIILIK